MQGSDQRLVVVLSNAGPGEPDYTMNSLGASARINGVLICIEHD
jgi:hypothetical protein